MKPVKRLFIMIMCISLCFSPKMSSAHSGRTDSSGGHHDYKNKSGLGSYHYHHGMEPHLHQNGVCPYSSTASASNTRKTSNTDRSSTVKKVQKKLNKLGYKCGKADGSCGSKTKSAIRKYQRDKGMTVNGKIDKALLRKMNIN